MSINVLKQQVVWSRTSLNSIIQKVEVHFIKLILIHIFKKVIVFKRKHQFKFTKPKRLVEFN